MFVHGRLEVVVSVVSNRGAVVVDGSALSGMLVAPPFSAGFAHAFATTLGGNVVAASPLAAHTVISVGALRRCRQPHRGAMARCRLERFETGDSAVSNQGNVIPLNGFWRTFASRFGQCFDARPVVGELAISHPPSLRIAEAYHFGELHEIVSCLGATSESRLLRLRRRRLYSAGRTVGWVIVFARQGA